jgi:hypothetical protein
MYIAGAFRVSGQNTLLQAVDLPSFLSHPLLFLPSPIPTPTNFINQGRTNWALGSEGPSHVRAYFKTHIELLFYLSEARSNTA